MNYIKGKLSNKHSDMFAFEKVMGPNAPKDLKGLLAHGTTHRAEVLN